MVLIQKRSWYQRPAAYCGLLLVLAVVVVILELTGTTHFFHQSSSAARPATPKGTTAGQGQPGTASKTQQGTVTTPSRPEDAKQLSNSGASLFEPTGNFVSAHKNVPVDAALSSVCNTTSGADCRIVFTNGGVTKSLPSQTTDSNGAAYWNSWTPASIELTPGTWQVQAVATLGTQTKTSNDALGLEIRP